MVGTVLEGDAKDHLLRGDAHLTFDPDNSRLHAVFFNIRDYDRFGAPHEMEKPRPEWAVWHHDQKRDQENYPTAYKKRHWIPGPSDSIRFGATVGENGRYKDDKGRIKGAFYGDGHAETAGTFEKHGIAGAFGAKKVVPETPGN